MTWSRVARAQGIEGFDGLLDMASVVVEKCMATGPLRLSTKEKTVIAVSTQMMRVLDDVIDLEGDRIVGPWSAADTATIHDIRRRADDVLH